MQRPIDFAHRRMCWHRNIIRSTTVPSEEPAIENLAGVYTAVIEGLGAL